MTKMIHDYTAAGTIDAAADYLLIDPASSGIYKKIARNTLLGLSSAPLGLTDSQSPTNKVFDNTNSLTVKDGSLTIQNTSSTTKQAVFSAASITAGQTRTFTFPDASGTIATIAGTQTLTNKTITSPAISGGTIDNAAITVDSISGHTTSTIVTVGGLQISNGVLNTSNAVTSTSVADGAIQPKALTSGTGSGWAWSTWVPTYSNFTLGNGTLNYAKYIQIGKNISLRLSLTLGSTSAFSGFFILNLPVSMPSGDDIMTSSVLMTDAGNAVYPGMCNFASTSAVSIGAFNASGTYVNVTGNAMNTSIPFTWGSGDGLQISAEYEAA